MSDYLGNLAAKSLAPEQAPAVQPRLASRFEPLAPETREAPGLLEETVTEIATPPIRPARVIAAVPPPMIEGVRPRRAEHFENLAVQQAPAAVGEPLVSRSVQPSEASPPAPPPLRSEKGREARAVVAHPEPLQRPVVIPSPSRHEAPVTSLVSSGEKRARGGVERADRPENRSSQEQRSVIPVLQPHVTLPERVPFTLRPEPPAAQPVIHVTIGRIEVRATPAPKAPVRERQAARPPVDLEEYLRQRSSGEGR